MFGRARSPPHPAFALLMPPSPARGEGEPREKRGIYSSVTVEAGAMAAKPVLGLPGARAVGEDKPPIAGRARAPAARLIAHREARELRLHQLRIALGRGEEIAPGFKLEPVAQPAGKMGGIARHNDGLAIAPDRAAGAGAMDDGVADAAQRNDGPRSKGN